MKRALITGITGQDGSYLAELLLAKGYEVHGIDPPLDLLQHRAASITIYRDPPRPGRAAVPALRRPERRQRACARLLDEIQPDEIYNLGAQSHVRVSLRHARVHRATSTAIGHGAAAGGDPRDRASTPRFYQASSSEMFGKVRETPQTETTPFYPRSPYALRQGVSPTGITVNYRESYGMYACNGILFNHESPAPRRDLRHPQDHPRRRRASSRACRRSSTWATSTPSATGATPATTSRPCG